MIAFFTYLNLSLTYYFRAIFQLMRTSHFFQLFFLQVYSISTVVVLGRQSPPFLVCLNG